MKKYFEATRSGGDDLGYDLTVSLNEIMHGDFQRTEENVTLVSSWVPHIQGLKYSFFDCLERILRRFNICNALHVDVKSLFSVPLCADGEKELATIKAIADTQHEGSRTTEPTIEEKRKARKINDAIRAEIKAECDANTLREWNAINDKPYSMADLSPLDDAGRKIMERVRREYRAPVERFSQGVWGGLHEWIDLQWAWCDEHDVDPLKFWGRFRGVERAFDLVSFKPPTPAIAEHLIAECVAAYQQAHKRALMVANADALMAKLEEVLTKQDKTTEELKKINRDTAGRRGGSKKESKCDAQHRKSGQCCIKDEAVYKAWREYTSGTADCELPTEGQELRKTKRTYTECLEAFGNKVVYHSEYEEKDYKLKELAPTPDELKKIVNTVRMRKTRHPSPARNGKNAQTAHKRARK